MMLSIVFIGFSIALALLLFLVFKLHKITQHQARQIEEIEGRSQSGKDDLALLSASAVGVDERIAQIEQRLFANEEQLSEKCRHEQGDSSYHSAIRRAQSGASFQQLVDECNVSREEAGLIIRLYGSGEQLNGDDSYGENRVDL
jgi:Protein of unknown function (DUF2802).